MSTIKRVAELNNSGASMLVERRDKHAMKMLQTSLTMIESRMKSVKDTCESPLASSKETPCGTIDISNSSSTNSTSSMTDTPESCFRNSARFALGTHKGSTDIPELKDDRYFIFNQALLVEIPETSSLPTHDSDDSDCPSPLICFYTSVVSSLSCTVLLAS